MLRSLFLLNLLGYLATNFSNAQPPPISFQHIGVKDGLNDGVINAITRDKYGFMWFASLGALNKFNSTGVRKFTHVQGDTMSLPNDIPYSIAAGNDDYLWIGYIHGLVEFNVFTGACRRIKALEDRNIFAIHVTRDNKLYIGNHKGLACYNPASDKLEEICDARDSISYKNIFKRPSYELYYHDSKIYLGSYKGVVVYDINTRKASFLDMPFVNGAVNKLAVDNQGFLWVSNYKNFQLLRVSPDLKQVEVLDTLLASKNDSQLSTALDMRPDPENRVWIITGLKGLLEYNLITKKHIFHRHNDQLPGSLTVDLLRTMYRSSDGLIWVTSNAGIDYFHPDKNLFNIIFPFSDEKATKYARGVAEDQAGNLWFTTGDGITKYNPLTRQHRYWKNESGKKEVIYHNSVRAIVEDDDHQIWIGTAAGVNKLDPKTGHTTFLTIKDSLPQAFYFSINKLRDGTIWFGTRDYDGFYYYSPADRKIHSIASHPVLKEFKGRGGRFVMEDSKKRLWFGFNSNGLGMYDPATNKARIWYNDSRSGPTIAGNLIVDIKEDKKGVVWVSAFGGLTGIDIEREKYYIFNDQNGMRSNISGPLAVDALNRLWVGTSAGLALLDSSRQFFTYFGEESGLPVNIFPEFAGYYLKNGDVLLPSVKGYVQFNPLHYRETKKNIDYYIASFKLFDQENSLGNATTQDVHLKAHENFFSINLVGLNFENPSHTWYAYQLEGFDKNWHYTQDPKAVYTNVPGGKYVFHYKATHNANDWNVPEKTLNIHVATVFYKAWWFWIAIAALIFTILYWVYRTRLSNQAQVHRLQSRAQLLEKEKTLVMYESLKQQLNPHFLFNSLTSLSGLIETDQKMAGNFLEQMSKIYRYILKNRDSEVVSLREEINFVQVYINLQKTRFKNGLQVFIDTDSAAGNRKIAPVTLQNLIENAIKHNIIDAESPLKIDVYTEQDYVVVRNNMQKKNVVETSNKQGLLNLQSLYQYLTNKPIIIEENEQYFIIKVPLI